MILSMRSKNNWKFFECSYHLSAADIIGNEIIQSFDKNNCKLHKPVN